MPEQSEGTHIADALRHSSPTARESVREGEIPSVKPAPRARRLTIRQGPEGATMTRGKAGRLTIRRVTELRLLQKIA